MVLVISKLANLMSERFVDIRMVDVTGKRLRSQKVYK